MRNKVTLCVLFMLALFVHASAREISGTVANQQIRGAEKIVTGKYSEIPELVQFRQGAGIPFSKFTSWARSSFGLSEEYGFKLLNSDSDPLGMVHYRYQQTYNDLLLEGTMFIVHVKNGVIQSVNGTLFNKLSASRAASLDESAALTKALGYMKASKYRWESAQQEAHLKQVTGNAQATWYPKGEQMLVPYHGNLKGESYRLAYRFDIYADQPMRREYVFVDAASGEIIYTINRIRNANSTATAVTKYSGNRNIITDSVNATSYRLRETGRGLGIETYNSQTTTNHPVVDFTDTDNTWNNVNAAQDEVATDAHWGAEITYDYYMLKFGRSSVDNAGQKLLSYVHFDVDLVNANWDGTHMNYGDGDLSQGVSPLTCLDVAGHEISHGVTEHTSNLIYQDEMGALNESFSDCMGNAIRQFGKNSATMNWLIGDEMGGTPFRDMSDPNQYGQPDTYMGTDWYAGAFDNGGVHTNSGVMNFWFYLLTEGGSGTNDNGDTYSIVGLGLDSAAAICYRMNSIYLVPTSQYADARRYAIQAAIDLYGPCTNPVIQTTNAWHAVGVGAAFSPTVESAFSAPQTVFCTAPAMVNFVNESFNAGSYTWDFGDGSPLSTAYDTSHTYLANGQYTVKLIADGGACGLDTMEQVQFVNVDPSNQCIVWLPASGAGFVQTSCTGFLYDNGGPNGNYLDQSESVITIAPTGASNVTLQFTSFNLEETYDFLYVYDGPNTTSALIGVYDGNTLPNGGSITSTGSSITLRMTTDEALTFSGFALKWQCYDPTALPAVGFQARTTTNCGETFQFTDETAQLPIAWHWNFGDGTTDTVQNPLHTYTANGQFTVTLVATNAVGVDSLVQTNYVTVNLPTIPVANNDTICSGSSASLMASGNGVLAWYDDPFSGTFLGTGSVYVTPALITPATYYVASEVYKAPLHAGPADNTFGGGSNFTNTNYRCQFFDCYSQVKLVSVLVYATGAGNRIITLQDGASVLATKTVLIPNGMSRVILNFDLPSGTDLELGIQGNISLYRNSGGAEYPYTVDGIVSITGNNAMDQSRYYFFYDWELQEPPCVSTRTAVQVSVEPAPTAAYTFNTSVLTTTFNSTSTSATGVSWDFGDPASGVNNTSNLANPVHVFSGIGTYNVCLVANGTACNDTLCQSILVDPTGIRELDESTGITVYPNPVSSDLVIHFTSARTGTSWKARISDILGKVADERMIPASQSAGEFSWDVSALAPGAYFLTLQSEEQMLVKKIIRQ